MATHIAATHPLDSLTSLVGTDHGDALTATNHVVDVRDVGGAGGAGSIDVIQGVPVLRLAGELDLLTHPQLQRMLRSVVTSSALTVVVDTSAVTFIDCAGLNPLLQAAADLRGRQARLLMMHPSVAVLQLSALTGTCEQLGLTSVPGPACG